MVDRPDLRPLVQAAVKFSTGGDEADLRAAAAATIDAIEAYASARVREALHAVTGAVATPSFKPPEFQKVSWGVDSTMRPMVGMAVSDHSFRGWAKRNGIRLIEETPDAHVNASRVTR